MGFLDFMKKTPPPAPQKPTELDELFAPPPVDVRAIERKLTGPEPDMGVPEPMETKSPFADDPPVEVQYAQLPEPIEEAPAEEAPPAEEPVSPPGAPINLPDFTDEEVAALEKMAQPAPPPRVVAEPAVPAPLPPPLPPQPAPQPVQQAPAPQQEQTQPEHEWKERLARVIRTTIPVKEDLPPPEMPAPEEPKLTFLSATAYFDIKEEMSGMRTSLRKADASILDASSLHEQTDEKMRLFASEINTVQERLTKFDEALFEE